MSLSRSITPEAALWIPRYDSWDRSDPEEHTRLILEAIEITEVVIAHAHRLLKHWSARHDQPLCSWHIKVFNLDAITEPMVLIDALESFFETADKSLADGDTPDPADVGPDIKPRVSRAHARTKLQAGLAEVRAARDAEDAGRPLRARHHLALLLPDIVDEPDAEALADQDREAEAKRYRRSSGLTGVGAGTAVSLPRVNSWGCG